MLRKVRGRLAAMEIIFAGNYGTKYPFFFLARALILLSLLQVQENITIKAFTVIWDVQSAAQDGVILFSE